MAEIEITLNPASIIKEYNLNLNPNKSIWLGSIDEMAIRMGDLDGKEVIIDPNPNIGMLSVRDLTDPRLTVIFRKYLQVRRIAGENLMGYNAYIIGQGLVHERFTDADNFKDLRNYLNKLLDNPINLYFYQKR
jgi:hypothetical protein